MTDEECKMCGYISVPPACSNCDCGHDKLSFRCANCGHSWTITQADV